MISGKGLMTLCALEDLVGQFIINKVIGEIDTMKSNRKVVDLPEVFILAFIAQKVVLNAIHLLFSLQETFEFVFLPRQSVFYNTILNQNPP
jgi:hypothetical protein